MILAQYAKKGLYNPQFFNKDNQYVIMDNGLYESQQVSQSLFDLVYLAEMSPIKIDEIIIPDVINDKEATQKLFIDNLDTIKKWSKKYRFMFVAQGVNEDDLYDNYRFLLNYLDTCNLSFGVSKLTPMDRCSKVAVALYRHIPFPIHFLGLKEKLSDFKEVKQYVRGLDTNQIECITYRHGVYIYDDNAIMNYIRDFNIDLETEQVNRDMLDQNLIHFKRKWNKLK